jgi:hypothetical protein
MESWELGLAQYSARELTMFWLLQEEVQFIRELGVPSYENLNQLSNDN